MYCDSTIYLAATNFRAGNLSNDKQYLLHFSALKVMLYYALSDPCARTMYSNEQLEKLKFPSTRQAECSVLQFFTTEMRQIVL